MQCREPSLIILPLRTTPLRSKNERGKIQTAIPRESLFGSVQRTQEEYRRQGNAIAQTALRLWQPPQMSFRGVKRRGNPLNRNATQWRLPLTALVLAITTAQKIFAISSSRDKNSCHNFARLSAWWVRALHASGIFHNANFVWISPCIARYNHKVISPALAISFSYPQL